MAKKIQVIIMILVLALIALIALIQLRPEEYHVARSGVINAPSNVAFSLINNFHEWGKWSPWDSIDLNMKKTFSGPSSGPGAVYV